MNATPLHPVRGARTALVIALVQRGTLRGPLTRAAAGRLAAEYAAAKITDTQASPGLPARLCWAPSSFHHHRAFASSGAVALNLQLSGEIGWGLAGENCVGRIVGVLRCAGAVRLAGLGEGREVG